MVRPSLVKLYRQKSDGTLAFLLPDGIRRALRWEAGTRLMVYTDRGRLVCERLPTLRASKVVR